MATKPKALPTDNQLELDGPNLLADFLKDEFYKDLHLNMYYSDLFDPLEFFRMHSKGVKFIETSDRYGETTAYLKLITLSNGHPLSYKQRRFLYEHIELWFKQNGTEYRLGITELLKLIRGLDPFDVLLEHLNTLPDDMSKLERLIQEETTWKQYPINANDTDLSGPSFGKKCKFEIAKFKKRLKLKKTQLGKPTTAVGTNVPDASNGKRKANKEIGELTEEQAAIFFHYFFDITGVNPDLPAARKIEVINSVTRWSGNSISNIFYDKKGGGVFSKANGDDFVEFEADMQAVKRLYQKLGLTAVVKMIEDEVEDIGGNL